MSSRDVDAARLSPQTVDDPDSRLARLLQEWQQRQQSGPPPTPEELCPDDVDLRERLRQRILQFQLEQRTTPEGDSPPPVSGEQPAVFFSDSVGVAPPGYTLLGELGRGGMGVVYHAVQLRLNRPAALKTTLGEQCDQRQLVRFLVEAEAMATVRHDNVAQVYECGEHCGRPFLALEYLEGGTLAQRLKAGQLSGRAAAELVLRITQGVEAAHRQGVIHRDLKPANVLFDAAGIPKVTDFGLAKHGAGKDLTATQTTMGTPAYMSPEQARGETRYAGPAADVYALGVILYECLTGTRPFEAERPILILEKVVHEPPEPPSRRAADVPHDLEVICLKCLRKEPEKRYASAAELADDLQRYLNNEPIKARPVGRFERAVKWVRRNPTRSVLGLVGVLLLLTAGVAFVLHQRELEHTRATTLVSRLRTASLEEVRLSLEDFTALRPYAEPKVRALLTSARANPRPYPRAELNAAVVLLAWDDAELDVVLTWALTAAPEDILVLRKCLTKHLRAMRQRLGPVVADRTTARAKRLRAQTLLADGAPLPTELADELTAQVLVEDRLKLSEWIEALRPLRTALLEPLLRRYREGTDDEAGIGAALVLREYLKSDTKRIPPLLSSGGLRQAFLLAEALRDAPDDRHQVLVARDRPLGDRLRSINARTFFWVDPNEVEDEDARDQARLNLAILAAGRGDLIWEGCKLSANPRLRTNLIHGFAQVGLPPQSLSEYLKPDGDPQVRQAIYLAWGEYPRERWSAAELESVAAQVARAYRDDPDPGVHSAAEWLLRRWKLEHHLCKLAPELPTEEARRNCRWFVNSLGMTFAVIPGARESWLGQRGWNAHAGLAPNHGSEAPHARWIDREFAIATTEVTHAQIAEFYRECKDYLRSEAIGKGWASREDDAPAGSLNWFEAVLFCRWLSDKEKVPESQQCYPPLAEIKPGMNLPPDYLRRTGYRLPTEAEWEYACRAGSDSPYWFGSDLNLLGRHAWYERNSDMRTHPVGQLKPNPYGLFDIHGNVFEWCGVRAEEYPARQQVRPTLADAGDSQPCHPDDVCVLRGGDFPASAARQTSSHRTVVPRKFSWPASGLRVARTIAGSALGVFCADNDGSRARYELRGVPGRFRVVGATGDATIEPREGSIPGSVTVSTLNARTTPYSFEVSRTDASGALAVHDLFLPMSWRVRWYSWEPDGSRPDHWPTEQAWARALQGKVLHEESLPHLTLHYPGKHPAAGVPATHCGMVATSTVEVPEGEYRFDAGVTDHGFRVFLDDEWLLERWWTRQVIRTSAVQHLKGGKHTLRVEYYKLGGADSFDLRIRRVSAAGTTPTKEVVAPAQRTWTEATFELAGTGGFEIVERTGDIEVTPRQGVGPTTLRMTGVDLHCRPFAFTLACGGERTRVWGTLAPGQLNVQPLRVNSVGMTLSLIPAGEFLRGSPQGLIDEHLRQHPQIKDYLRMLLNSETPQHRVQLSKPFGLGVYEVTVGQFRQFVADTRFVTQAERDGGEISHLIDGKWVASTRGYSWRDPHNVRSEGHPVVQLTWHDARAFCAWLSKREKVTYRLPTEAEWEYACRAGRSEWWYFGNDAEPIHEHAWHRHNSELKPQPVGLKRPNRWGLFDMYGNVNEWCADHFGADYYRLKEGKDPQGSATGTGWHVLRGGDVWFLPDDCRSASRAQGIASHSGNLVGFRVAADPWTPTVRVRLASVRHLPAHEYEISGRRHQVEVVAGHITTSTQQFGSGTTLRIVARQEQGGSYALHLIEPDTQDRKSLAGQLLGTSWEVRFHARTNRGSPIVAPTVEEWKNMLATPALLSGRVPQLDFAWGHEAPGPNVPDDHFGVVARTEIEVPREAEGKYRFVAVVDNGLRLFVDDVLVHDRWETGLSLHPVSAVLSLKAGKRRLRVEYFEHSKLAELRCRLLAPCSSP